MKDKAAKKWANGRAITLLFIANFISGIAQGMSMIAIPWYFTQQGETSLLGYVYGGITLISLFWGPYSGTLVDRYDRRKIFLVLNIVLAVILLAVSYYGFQNGGLSWQWVAFIYLMTFLNYNLHYPNLYAFTQEITEKRNYGKIMSYMEMLGQFASVLAGAAAALLLEGTKDGVIELFGQKITLGFDIPAWGIHQIFLVDGITYLISFVIIYLVRYQTLVPRSQEVGSVLSRLKIGFNFLKENPMILVFGIASYSIFVCVLVSIFYTTPIYVEKFLQEDGSVYASSEICYAVGAIFAGGAIRYIFNEKRVSILMSIIIMTILTAILLGILTFNSFLPLFFLLTVLLGVTNAGTRIQRITYLFRKVPNQFFGRAGSVFFISNIIFRIGFVTLFTLPFFQSGDNIKYTMGVLSIFLLISAGVLIAFYKRIRNYG